METRYLQLIILSLQHQKIITQIIWSLTDKSVKLTRDYHDEIALWQRINYSNATTAKITGTYIPQFIKQINNFNNTATPQAYSKIKDNFVSLISSKIKRL